MKTTKLVLSIFTIVILISCASGTYRQATHVSNQAYLGMTIAEFKSISKKKASLEALEAGYTVFRINDYDSWTGAITDTKFYYFDSNSKLVKIDGGQFKQQRYQVEIKN
jgi:hypothetical protein